MKFIKNHLTFILPMMAILLGVEFFLVFDRTTQSYEAKLKDGYSMFIVANRSLNLGEFKSLSKHINSIEEINKEALASQISKGVNQSNSEEILKSLPYFYNVKLDSYLDSISLKGVRGDLEESVDIKRVETFGNSYTNSYKLFSFIKFILKIFIGFMGLVSLLLIFKQMEIWKYIHKERMQVMEIFGASLMQRSGILFRVALVDAILSTIFTSAIFMALKHYWARDSHIDILMQKQDLLFQSGDALILLSVALMIVIMSVYLVVFSNKEQ